MNADDVGVPYEVEEARHREWEEQINEAVFYEQWYGEYRETCDKRDALDAAFTAVGALPVATTRRIRLTEAL